MKKILIVFLVLSVFTAVLFAGGAKEEGPGKVTLTIAGRDGAYGDAMQLAADAYKAQNPEVSFEILKLSGAACLKNPSSICRVNREPMTSS